MLSIEDRSFLVSLSLMGAAIRHGANADIAIAGQWPTVDAAVEEARETRIVGGMHFRFATLAGEKLGAERLDDAR